MKYVVIDIEASSLSKESYPIEFAFGNSSIGIESFLINTIDVKEWIDWDINSENVHNISKEMLSEHGVSVKEAWQRIRKVFSTYKVYSDAPTFDSHWLNAFLLLGEDVSCIKVHNVADMVRMNLDKTDRKNYSVIEMYERASREVTPTHRAAKDVEYLLKAIELSERK